MQAGDQSEQIKGLYVTQIVEDKNLTVLTGSNQFSVSDKVIRSGIKNTKKRFRNRRNKTTRKCNAKRCSI